MKRADAERLIRAHLLPHFPGFGVSGDVMFQDEPSCVLRGVLLNRSQLDRHTFQLVAFAQLLAVPSDGVELGVSKQLGRYDVSRGERAVFHAVRDDIHENAVPFLALVSDCRSLADHVEQVTPYTMDPGYASEVRGYALILAGDFETGRAALLRAMDMEREQGELRLIPPRAEPVLDLLARDPEAARRELRARVARTARAIGMPTGL